MELMGRPTESLTLEQKEYLASYVEFMEYTINTTYILCKLTMCDVQ